MADNEVKIPTIEEIAKLPLRARIAFAARCARRVQPLFVDAWPDAPQKHIDAVDKAITLAEASAVSPAPASDLLNAAYAATDTANFAADAATNATDTANFAADAANAAAYAATDAATDTANAATNAANAANAANFATNAAAYANAAATNAAATNAIRNDFELLKGLAKRGGWGDDTPVPSEVFGPMWPEGAPEGWPEEEGADEPCCLKLDVASPVGMSDAQSTVFNQKMAAFFAELSALHVGMGGTGLKILDQDSFESELVDHDQLVCDPSTSSGVLV